MEPPPVWKKPSDVMKIHRRRKSVSQRRITTDADKRTSIIYKSPSKCNKRKNPFHKDSPHPFPAKRQNIDFKENVSSDPDPLSCQLFNLLDSANESKSHGSNRKSDNAEDILRDQQYSDVQKHAPATQDATSPLNKPSTPLTDVKQDSDASPFLPIDWSLKTKLRVVSSRPLSWCTQLKSADEAHGVVNFVRDTGIAFESTTDEKRQFQRSCMYWAHPNIPWMKLFPRIIEDSKSSIVPSHLLQEDIQKSLQADWEQSFSSAYHQLRSRLCPYFYLCTHQFTVLFYNGSESQSGSVAMVTPTTRGFRESLENEGINFKLPVGNKSQSPDKDENKTNLSVNTDDDGVDKDMKPEKSEDVDEDTDDILATDDAAHGWLESMGLDKKQFPSLDPKKVKLQREGYRVIDHRPESLVWIEGSDVQALFNFLLNCRTCVAMSGMQAGLPPTVLSPTPFKGATLKSHKVKHTVVKQSDKDGIITQAHIVEVTGPILPHHCQNMVSLLHRTQCADYGMVFNNHYTTVPFNVLSRVVRHNNKMKSDNRHSFGRSNTSRIEPDCSAILDSIHEEEEEDNASVRTDDVTSEKRDHEELQFGKFHRLVPVDEERVCAIKEVICTPGGYTWTS